jgi:hypothetical protein
LNLPKLSTGTFSVSGISALMRDAEIIKSFREIVLPLFAEGSVFMPYLKPYALLQSLEKRLNLEDEGILVPEQVAQPIDEAQQAQQEQAIQVRTAQEAAAGQEALDFLAEPPPGEQGGAEVPVPAEGAPAAMGAEGGMA